MTTHPFKEGDIVVLDISSKTNIDSSDTLLRWIDNKAVVTKTWIGVIDLKAYISVRLCCETDTYNYYASRFKLFKPRFVLPKELFEI
jgi:hypothetical protein